NRSPQWRHGGIVFGPHPRSYRQDMPKQMRRKALAASLSEKVRLEDLIIVENLVLSAPKTKEMKAVLDALKLDKSVLLVADGASPEVLRAAKNIQKLDTLPAYQLNAYDVLRHKKIVLTVDAVRKAEELWAGPTRKNAMPESEPVAEAS
ncbi:MAG: 50S ribosomal protein L4, partial [Chloroflexi bacterium]|nr:50S ribosomal protein L4 [Chloroflexota bacterium]